MVPATKSVEDFAKQVGRECGNMTENQAGDKRLAEALKADVRPYHITDEQFRELREAFAAGSLGVARALINRYNCDHYHNGAEYWSNRMANACREAMRWDVSHNGSKA
jgi:hypothetical protein